MRRRCKRLVKQILSRIAQSTRARIHWRGLTLRRHRALQACWQKEIQKNTFYARSHRHTPNRRGSPFPGCPKPPRPPTLDELAEPPDQWSVLSAGATGQIERGSTPALSTSPPEFASGSFQWRGHVLLPPFRVGDKDQLRDLSGRDMACHTLATVLVRASQIPIPCRRWSP